MNRDVIIACDFESKAILNDFIKEFESLENKPYLKIGMEMFYSNGPILIKELKEKGFKIFLDLKLHDIPTTVHKAMRQIAKLGVDMTNVHASGGIMMMREAKKALEGTSTQLIAVTQLTSTSKEIMNNELLIDGNVDVIVKEYAKNTKEAGLDGVVCSALESPIMNELGLMSVTPGIRLNEANKQDQIRVVTPQKAKELKSSYIVVGRSITKAENRLEAYNECLKQFI